MVRAGAVVMDPETGDALARETWCWAPASSKKQRAVLLCFLLTRSPRPMPARPAMPSRAIPLCDGLDSSLHTGRGNGGEGAGVGH